MNREMRRHPTHHALPLPLVSKRRVVDTKRQKTHVTSKQYRKGRKKV